MITNNEKPRWPFYLTWIILTYISIPIALLLNFLVIAIIQNFTGDFVYVNGGRRITEDYLFMYTYIPIVSLLTGALQYVLLRRYLPRMGGWVWATIAGWLLGVFLIALPTWLNWTVERFYLDSLFILMGLAIGVGQWLILRGRLPQAGWWIGANIVGWGLSGLIITGRSLDQFAVFTVGILPACVTAAVLALLMKQVKSAQANGV